MDPAINAPAPVNQTSDPAPAELENKITNVTELNSPQLAEPEENILPTDQTFLPPLPANDKDGKLDNLSLQQELEKKQQPEDNQTVTGFEIEDVSVGC